MTARTPTTRASTSRLMPRTPSVLLVAVVGGPNSYNYVNIYNQNGRGTNVSVATSGQCSYTALAPVLTNVTNLANTAFTADVNGYYLAGGDTSAKINGTDTRPGWPISVSANFCGNYKQFLTTTSGTPDGSGKYPWTITVPAYKDYTYYYVEDGSSSFSVSLYATNNVLTPTAINASVTGGIKSYDYSCGSADWDVTAGGTGVKQITVTGTVSTADGTGTVRLPSGSISQFTISGGSFTISGIVVYDGWNNVQVYDTRGNGVTLNVLTANNEPKPPFVKFTLPTMNQNVAPGSYLIQGSITDPSSSGYAPTYMYAYIYGWDGTSYTYQRFSTDLYEQQNGYGTLTLGAGTFSFTGNINQNTTWTEIYVSGYDYVRGLSHGDDIYVNTGSTWGEWYWKTGGTRNPAKKSDPFSTRVMMRDIVIHNANLYE